MRDAQRIEREQRAAIDKHADEKQCEIGAAEQGRHGRGAGAHHRDAEDHHPAVKPVRQPAHRILQDQRADHRRRHEIADLGVTETDRQAIDSPHAEQHRNGHPVDAKPDNGQRRDLQQAAQAHPLRLFKGRRLANRQQHRHDGDRDQHRGKEKQDDTVLAAGTDHQLADGQPAHRDDHVERQHLAPCLVGRLVVQPAFADDIHAGKAESGENAHQGPDHRIDKRRNDQNGGRGQRRHGAEDANMSDIVEHSWHQNGAAENPQEIARHHKAGGDLGKSGLSGFGAKQNDLQPVAGHDQQQAEKQRP